MTEAPSTPNRLAHRRREIPWLQVVKFHKEIVTRADEGFFALNGKDDQSVTPSPEVIPIETSVHGHW